MPANQFAQMNPVIRHATLLCTLITLTAAPASAAAPKVVPVRARQAELHYQLTAAPPSAAIECWYTRDRGASWNRYGIHTDHTQPVIFKAPAEGLYGFILTLIDNDQAVSAPPAPNTPPQRWVFIDYTPPLLQWDSVEPADAFAARRTVQLRWTAHDSNLTARPISLAYQSSVDQTWKTIESALPNTGRYDWVVPIDVSGQVTLSIAVRDRGDHIVKRTYGPLPIKHWFTTGVALTSPEAPATQPAQPSSRHDAAPLDAHLTAAQTPTATTRPAIAEISDADRLRAKILHGRGNWHFLREDYPLAAERFREALEINPNMLPALNGLAESFRMQKNYDQAIDFYKKALMRDKNNASSLWGAHLAYVAQRQYPQSHEMLSRLLADDENNAEAWLHLGDVVYLMGKSQEARQHWQRATEVDAEARDVIEKAKYRLGMNSPRRVTGRADARTTR